MNNLTQGQKVAVWSGIIVAVIAFLFLGFFQNQVRQASDSILLEDDNILENSNNMQGELQIEDVIIGDGEQAEAGDTVTVHYVGELPDGTKFDSSIDRGQPFTFVLGQGQVIAGWDEGVEGMRVGGVRKLVIPPHLAYGNQAIGSIPPNSTLHFEVQLLGVE